MKKSLTLVLPWVIPNTGVDFRGITCTNFQEVMSTGMGGAIIVIRGTNWGYNIPIGGSMYPTNQRSTVRGVQENLVDPNFPIHK